MYDELSVDRLWSFSVARLSNDADVNRLKTHLNADSLIRSIEVTAGSHGVKEAGFLPVIGRFYMTENSVPVVCQSRSGALEYAHDIRRSFALRCREVGVKEKRVKTIKRSGRGMIETSDA